MDLSYNGIDEEGIDALESACRHLLDLGNTRRQHSGVLSIRQ
jgi:hypothetical protein